MSGYFAGGLDLRVEVAGEVQVHERLEGVLRRVEDWTPALREMAASFHEHMQDAFLTEGGATRAGRWAPLSPKYAAWKEQHFPHRGLLVQTGKLRDALQGEGPDAVERIEPHELEVGSSRRVGAWDLGLLHQLGRGRLPVRKAIDIPEELTSRWVRLLIAHLQGNAAEGADAD